MSLVNCVAKIAPFTKEAMIPLLLQLIDNAWVTTDHIKLIS